MFLNNLRNIVRISAIMGLMFLGANQASASKGIIDKTANAYNEAKDSTNVIAIPTDDSVIENFDLPKMRKEIVLNVNYLVNMDRSYKQDLRAIVVNFDAYKENLPLFILVSQILLKPIIDKSKERKDIPMLLGIRGFFDLLSEISDTCKGDQKLKEFDIESKIDDAYNEIDEVLMFDLRWNLFLTSQQIVYILDNLITRYELRRVDDIFNDKDAKDLMEIYLYAEGCRNYLKNKKIDKQRATKIFKKCQNDLEKLCRILSYNRKIEEFVEGEPCQEALKRLDVCYEILYKLGADVPYEPNPLM